MKFLFLLTLTVFTSCKSDSARVPAASIVSNESATTPSTSETPSTNIPSTIDRSVEELMRLINEHRNSIGLRALTLDLDLSHIAKAHSQNMADKKISFGHSGFSSRCSEARDAIGGGNLCSENVAMGQSTAQAALNTWMNSSVHKANIEQERSTHTGIGVAINSQGTSYWTQIFIEKN